MLSPWREMSWTDNTRDDLRERFLSHVVAGECVSSARVLLLGPTGAGKSSFINSIRSVMFKRITHMTLTGPQASNRFKKLRSCSIRSERGGNAISLTLCDVMALGEKHEAGLSNSDALSVIKGHVSEGYKFSEYWSITSETRGYKGAPAISDKIHAVLFVLDARKVSSYSSHLQRNMRELQAEISDLDVPQLVLLTHVDQVCHAVQEDVQFVYRSRPVKDKMHQAAQFLDMPVSYVLPVKNYASELSTSCSTDILLLSAVDTVLQAIDDTLDYQCTNTSTATGDNNITNSVFC
ncbi:interferon-induced protein 44-like [Engraulis encrasicolus]|uniref:interferon-induced protein 44-like n=1 Tax=Engraulis encrasicolus TaxID=184585 RepID=UPI002FD41B1D